MLNDLLACKSGFKALEEPDLMSAVISEQGDQVFLQLHEPITTYLLPFLTIEMYLQVILQIKKTEHGLVISRQEV